MSDLMSDSVADNNNSTGIGLFLLFLGFAFIAIGVLVIANRRR